MAKKDKEKRKKGASEKPAKGGAKKKNDAKTKAATKSKVSPKDAGKSTGKKLNKAPAKAVPVANKPKMDKPVSLPPTSVKPKTASKGPRTFSKTQTPAKPNTPVVKIVLCGPHSIYWIPKDTDINGKILEEGLHPKEKDTSKNLKAPARRNEFLRARWLFRRVSKIKEPLLKASSGEPVWPPGLLGSISHKDGHVLFCKASTETHFALGIDIEKINKVSTNIESKIITPEENQIIDRVCALARLSRQEVMALIFSFKEAIFKTHYPTGKKQFGFHDVMISEIAYERREIFAKMKIDTSPHSPTDHQTIGFYNWIDYSGEKFVVVAAEERKPMQLDKSLKEELLAETEEEKPAVVAVVEEI